MTAPVFRTFGVVSKPRNRTVVAELENLIQFLGSRDREVKLDTEAAALVGAPPGIPRDELAAQVDILVVLGGDGTLLSVARSAAAAGCPVFGVNYGALGFLTSTTRDELIEATELILAGEYSSSDRSMLRAAVVGPDGKRTLEHDVLNDAVITKTELARIVELRASVDGDLVSRFRADGLIICSATGSTAYSLAAGGPIVMPQVDATVLTPISPHTLTNRPLVLPGDAVVEIRHDSQDQEVMLTLDGQVGVILGPGETVTVGKAPNTLRLLHPLPRSYFDVLRTKLQWGQS